MHRLTSRNMRLTVPNKRKPPPSNAAEVVGARGEPAGTDFDDELLGRVRTCSALLVVNDLRRSGQGCHGLRFVAGLGPRLCLPLKVPAQWCAVSWAALRAADGPGREYPEGDLQGVELLWSNTMASEGSPNINLGSLSERSGVRYFSGIVGTLGTSRIKNLATRHFSLVSPVAAGNGISSIPWHSRMQRSQLT
jgi:hypothetical protein